MLICFIYVSALLSLIGPRIYLTQKNFTQVGPVCSESGFHSGKSCVENEGDSGNTFAPK